MGCHTWTYKKIDLPLEKAKELLIETHQKIIDEYTAMPESEYAELIVNYPYMYDSKERLIELYQRRIKRIQNPNIKAETIYYHLGNFCDRNIEYTDKGLFEETEYHDPFRIAGYPEDCLYSLKECLEYIKKYEEKHNCTVTVQKYLEEFWNKYPDGMINFG